MKIDGGCIRGLLVLAIGLVACSSADRTPVISLGGDGVSTADGQDAHNQNGSDGRADGVNPDSSGDAADGGGDSGGVDQLAPSDIVDNPSLPCDNMTVTWLDGVCAAFCGQLVTFNLNDLFSPPDECHAMCRDVIDEHPDWLANFICVTAMEQHYFFGNCWWPKPLPAIKNCPAWCDELIGCGLESAVNLPGDKCICDAACNGIFAITGEAADPLLECATKALADSCSLETVNECFDMPLNCEETCEGLAEKCDEGEDLSSLFPDDGDCIDFCQHSNQQAQFGVQVCIGVAGCPDADRCEPFPEETDDGCEEFCDSYNALCPGAEIPAEYCPWACTGAAMAIPGSDVASSADCINALDQCPYDEGATFVGCLAGQCTLMCYSVSAECELGSAYFELYPNGAVCEEVCDQYTPFQAEVAAMCHLVAGCDNPELCDAPPLTVTSGCGAYCEGLQGLCPDIPWFSGISCEAFCTGMLMVMPDADPASAPDCFDAFGVCPDDWEEAIFTCLYGKCGGMCGHFDECDADSQYYDSFESEDACKELCSLLDWDTAMAMNWCLSWGACEGAEQCMTLPDEPPVGCDIYCETVFEICPDNGMGGANACDSACLGLTMAFDSAQPWDADECFDEYDACPENSAEIVYGCIIDADSSCVEACAQLDSCDLTESWVCEIFCSELEADDPLFHTYFTDCVEDATTCEELAPCVGQ